MAAAPAFRELPLHADVARALTAMGFLRPSPIQLRALPVALFGNDVVGQAKSGTGKTAVFGVAAVELAVQRRELQRREGAAGVSSAPLALILAPTREIAVQIEAVLRQIAQFRPECVVTACIGGLPIADDQKRLRSGCDIVVGTPGRVKALIDQGTLLCQSLRLFVLDEVDKLLAREFEKDIEYIVAALPQRRQTLAFSATFTVDQLEAVASLMRKPQIVRVRGPNDVTVEFIASPSAMEHLKEREQNNKPELWLRRVKQFYSVIPSTEPNRFNPAQHLKSKIVRLVALLSDIVFSQCIVFCNDKLAAEALAAALRSQGWPSACITGTQPQSVRLQVMDDFRSFRSRVLISTDLTSRGIDIDSVNFVINLDLPRDPATYLHRVGRTGRFGGKVLANEHGIAVTLLSEREVEGIQLLARVFKMQVLELPSPVPREIYSYTSALPEEDDDTQGVDVSTHTQDRATVVQSLVSHPIIEKEKVRQVEIEDTHLMHEDDTSKPGASASHSIYEREEALYLRWIKRL